jgi:hypothetical protein
VKRATVLFLALGACARIAAPPGGPPDNLPPILIGTQPDSVAILAGFDDAVEFRFDEVVSEGGQPNFGLGTGDLERLIVLSPTNEIPQIGWHRDRISVRPREGWQPNRVYRVELLAGVRDLRNNSAKSSTVVTFSTGAPLPTDSLVGLVVEWTTQRPARGALVEAVLQPDSLVYRTQADSVGRFTFAPLPAGEYVVYGVIDANRNNRLDPREAFDSVRVAASRALVGELWTFRHDTAGPRLQAASSSDSVTATLSFTTSLDPYQRLPGDSAVVRLLPDSTPVAVEFLLPQQSFDSLLRARRAAEDSVKRAALPDSAGAPAGDSARVPARDAARRTPVDTAAPRIVGVPRQVTGARRPAQDTTANQPLRTKPPLFDRLVLRVATPWRDSTRYVIEVHGVRTVSGTPGSVRAILTIPPKRRTDGPADRRTDSTAAVPDSLRPPADTARRDTTGVTFRRSVLPSFRP